MGKMFSLLRASLTDNMSIFNIKSKKQGASKKLLPFFLAAVIVFYMWIYANMLMEEFDKVGMTFVALTLFVFVTTLFTIVEGIYKSSSLLFNCKDDNLMFSLPLRKGTVLGLRIFKFYLFEVVYNALFLAPAMFTYTQHVSVDASYYFICLLALILLPVIPVALSCVIGMIISAFSARFKKKNFIQIIVTTIFLLGVMYVAFNLESLLGKLAEHATSINDLITKLYYPAGAFTGLVTNFSVNDLLFFIGIHVVISAAIVFLLSRIYFKINSRVHAVKVNKKSTHYKIKTHNITRALIGKEAKKFATSPVFVTNAAFGLVLFVAGVIVFSIKADDFIASLNAVKPIDPSTIYSVVPLALIGFIIVSCLMSSITSSMISLEGKSFNILKSLPVKPYTIIKAKILTAVLVCIPFILIGDIIAFIRFDFNILEIILTLIASFIVPLVAQTIGIIVNLRFPKMDALNDAEVVKQSASSTVAVFAGLILSCATGYVLLQYGPDNVDLTIALTVLAYTIIYCCLHIYLRKTSVKRFNEIQA